MPLSQTQKKQFRKIAHQLKPVILIGDKGLSENVHKEIDRALEDHELIKIKVRASDRDTKKTEIAEICSAHQAELIQQVGNIAVFYRSARKPNPKLSAILKFSQN